ANNVGGAIHPPLSDLPAVRIDSTAPSITAPPDIVTNADAGVCTYSLLGPGWRTFGDTTLHDGVAECPSLSTLPFQYGGAELDLSAPFPYSALTTLSTDYAMLLGCFHGGAPRFEIGIDVDGDGSADGNIFVYLGTPPSWGDCPPLGVWTNTGNMVTLPDGSWDGSQLGAHGGAYGQTH